jgi:hypothetical protein
MPKISELNTITGANLAPGDKIEIVDVSDFTMAPTGTNKQTTLNDIQRVAGTTGATVMFSTKIAGDAQDRFQILANGTVRQGDGTVAPYASPLSDCVTMPMLRPGNQTYHQLPANATRVNIVQTNGTGYYTPLMVPVKTTLTELGVSITFSGAGSSGSVVRMGLYADSATTPGIPDALITDYGTVATTTNNVNAWFTGLTTVLQPYVLYWVLSVSQGGATTQPTLRGVNMVGVWGSSTLTTGVVGGPQTNAGAVTGALPATANVASAGSTVGITEISVRFNTP